MGGQLASYLILANTSERHKKPMILSDFGRHFTNGCSKSSSVMYYLNMRYLNCEKIYLYLREERTGALSQEHRIGIVTSTLYSLP